MHPFEDDFYSSNLKTVITGYLRSMKSYNSLSKSIFTLYLIFYKLIDVFFLLKMS